MNGPRSDRVLCYLRVSTEEQALSGAGIGAQRSSLETEALGRGWAEVEWVTDDGYSAKDLKRPGIRGALADLASGRAGTLAVARLDRLSRSTLDFASLVERARKQGWELVVLSPSFDLTSPEGSLMGAVFAAFAEFERALIGQRTAEALAVRKSQGVRLGRPSTLDPRAVERLVDLRAQGESWRAVAEVMTAEGWVTAHGAFRWAPATCRAVWLRVQDRSISSHVGR